MIENASTFNLHHKNSHSNAFGWQRYQNNDSTDRWNWEEIASISKTNQFLQHVFINILSKLYSILKSSSLASGGNISQIQNSG